MLRELAREMRKQPTSGERLAWEKLRGRRLLGLKFRRQAPIAGFIVDFYCRELRLAIEIDGPSHWTEEARARDLDREAILRSLGIRVLHLEDGPELLDSLEKLVRIVHDEPPPPLRLYGEGAGG